MIDEEHIVNCPVSINTFLGMTIKEFSVTVVGPVSKSDYICPGSGGHYGRKGNCMNWKDCPICGNKERLEVPADLRPIGTIFKKLTKPLASSTNSDWSEVTYRVVDHRLVQDEGLIEVVEAIARKVIGKPNCSEVPE